VGLLEFLSQAFIDFFGITQPNATSKKRATLFICGLLSLLVIIPALALWIIYGRSH
jgi:hypothetical protein